jgi:hypothetical protein
MAPVISWRQLFCAIFRVVLALLRSVFSGTGVAAVPTVTTCVACRLVMTNDGRRRDRDRSRVYCQYSVRTTMSASIAAVAKERNWSLPVQGLVLSSFYFGYLVPSAVGGVLARRLGGKVRLAAALRVGLVQ